MMRQSGKRKQQQSCFYCNSENMISNSSSPSTTFLTGKNVLIFSFWKPTIFIGKCLYHIRNITVIYVLTWFFVFSPLEHVSEFSILLYFLLLQYVFLALTIQLFWFFFIFQGGGKQRRGENRGMCVPDKRRQRNGHYSTLLNELKTEDENVIFNYSRLSRGLKMMSCKNREKGPMI